MTTLSSTPSTVGSITASFFANARERAQPRGQPAPRWAKISADETVTPRRESGRSPRVCGDLVRLLRLAPAAASRPARDRLRARSPDLHLVVRVVAACDRDLDEPVRHARPLCPGRDQPRLDAVVARARTRFLAAHRPLRAGRLLQRRRACVAGARGLDGVPPLPRAHAVG